MRIRCLFVFVVLCALIAPAQDWQACKPQSQLFCFPIGLLYSSQSKTNIQSGTRMPYLIAAAVQEQKVLVLRR